jgi:hypothetical protein
MEPGSTLLVQVGQHKGGIVFVHKGFTDPETQTPRVKDKTHFWKKTIQWLIRIFPYGG